MSAVPQRKRPWYLVVALVLSTLFGACGWMDGYQTMMLMRDTQVDAPSQVEELPENAAKARTKEAYSEFIQERDRVKSRAFPLAVGTFIAGAAVLAFAVRAFAGRATSKKLLVQFVLLQTALIATNHFAMPALRRKAEAFARELGQARAQAQAKSDAERAQAEALLRSAARITPIAENVWLGVRGFASLFVVLSLTRRRTREYFGESAFGVGDASEVDPPASNKPK